jgi:3-phosphoshikimate 1-carboxyvinyltransferase
MLASFGAQVRLEQGGVTVAGRPLLQGREIVVPGDISSAAFFMVAGLIVPGSELLIKNVGLNPTRNGVVEVLRSMGGSLDVLNARDVAGEPVADILVTSSQLHGVEIGGAMIPRLIDEIPVLGVAAACAEGTTVIRDAAELRVKETDRIAAVAAELRKLGGQIEEFEDGMAITGVEHLQGGRVDSHGDHRIAMSMAVAALSSRAVVDICDIGCTQTSFPNFWQLLAGVCQ